MKKSLSCNSRSNTCCSEWLHLISLDSWTRTRADLWPSARDSLPWLLHITWSSVLIVVTVQMLSLWKQEREKNGRHAMHVTAKWTPSFRDILPEIKNYWICASLLPRLVSDTVMFWRILCTDTHCVRILTDTHIYSHFDGQNGGRRILLPVKRIIRNLNNKFKTKQRSRTRRQAK
jgi:hypothetical protein